MSTAKAQVRSLLDQLPDDASLEDIQYHLYVLEKVKRGVSRAGPESAMSTEEVKGKLRKWVDS